MDKGFEEIEQIIGEVLAENHLDGNDDTTCDCCLGCTDDYEDEDTEDYGPDVPGFMDSTDRQCCGEHCAEWRNENPYLMGVDYAADDNTLSVVLSTGTSYTVDCDQKITTSLLENMTGIKENLTTIRRMLLDVISQNDNDLDVVVSHEIKRFFDDLGIEEDYLSIRDDISNREVAMLMCFDAINVITTMISKVEGE